MFLLFPFRTGSQVSWKYDDPAALLQSISAAQSEFNRRWVVSDWSNWDSVIKVNVI